ncbi:MAG: UDP-N-acetylmuramoyl-L-alanyl-D-glutamate--2,6-diaminopimelate ligase [Pseudomonadales bacterium]
MGTNTQVTLRSLFQDMTLPDVPVCDITEDSREVVAGSIFVAREGEHFNGCAFIEKAVLNGAVAVLVDSASAVQQTVGIPVITLDNMAQKVGAVAAKIFANAAEKLQIIGVTGTNGKTSCAHYITQCLTALGVKSYIVGTVGNGDPQNLSEASRTTPDACRLHRMLAQFYAEGARAVVMEVSSHALEQGRVNGVPFNLVAYTNLSRDHLDYHGTMQAYAAAKAKLFTQFDAPHQVFNLDDEYSSALHAQCNSKHPQRVAGYGLKNGDLHLQDRALAEQGLSFTLKLREQSVAVSTALIGQFNLSNLLLTATALDCLGYEAAQISRCLAQLKPVPGRMEVVPGEHSALPQPLCLVDYAHTPDALQKVLQASRVHCEGQLYAVFGCGGDRDGGKRALMASVAEREADVTIVTSDNPRTESPQQIVEDVCQGFGAESEYQVIVDRRAAIFAAVAQASAADVVVIAGKGHEDYQEIMGVKHPFLDRNIVEQALKARVEKKSEGLS